MHINIAYLPLAERAGGKCYTRTQACCKFFLQMLCWKQLNDLEEGHILLNMPRRDGSG